MAAKLTHAGLLVSALLAACASSPRPRIDDVRLARLPPAEREALIDRHREVDIAQSNAATAQVALQDAEQFRSIVGNEQGAARERQAGAHKSVELMTKTGGRDQNGVEQARTEETLAAQRLNAANAKVQYAENLVSLRKRQVDLRQAELGLANANMELDRYERLAAANEAAGLDRGDFLQAREDAQKAVAERKTGVDTSRAAVQASQHAWNELRGRFNSASRAGGGDNSNEAPVPPQPID